MATTTIDAALVQKMFLAGAKNLESKKEWINDLNVFPVPDGDTGTNMTLTIMSAAMSETVNLREVLVPPIIMASIFRHLQAHRSMQQTAVQSLQCKNRQKAEVQAIIPKLTMEKDLSLNICINLNFIPKSKSVPK